MRIKQSIGTPMLESVSSVAPCGMGVSHSMSLLLAQCETRAKKTRCANIVQVVALRLFYQPT